MKKGIIFAILSVLMFAYGCKEVVNDKIVDNRVYINNGYYEKTSISYLEGKNAVPVDIAIRGTHLNESSDVVVTLSIDQEALNKFNEQYGKSYVMYEDAVLESNKVTIKAGEISSIATLLVTPLTQERMATGNIYAIPVTIVGASGAGILMGSETYIYVVKVTPRATTLVMDAITSGASGAAQLFMPLSIFDDHASYTFTAYTLEFLIKFNSFTPANNYDLINATVGVPTGYGGELYTRLEGGSAGLDKGSFNIKFNGDNESISAGTGIKTGVWYHVAFVYGNGMGKVYINGVEGTSMTVTLPSLTLGSNEGDYRPVGAEGFTWGAACGNSGYTGNAGSRASTESAEVRIWNVARTTDQLREYMYSVNPDSEGLLGYWKLNGQEPDGTFKDETGKNPNAYMIKFKASENKGDNTNKNWATGWSLNESNQELTVGE